MPSGLPCELKFSDLKIAVELRFKPLMCWQAQPERPQTQKQNRRAGNGEA